MSVATRPATKTEHPFDRRERALKWILEHEPVTLTTEQENILMYGSPDVPGWATDLARNEGIPTKPQPDKCSACKVPIWRWSAKLKDWVCLGCKVHDIVHLRKDGDLGTLEGCFASGINEVKIEIDRSLPDHPCYRCDKMAWVWDKNMKNYRCNVCYPS